VDVEETSKITSPPAPPVRGRDNGPMRVLIVEDDPAVAAGMSDGLGAAAIDADHVATGEAALTAVASGDYELVVLDLGLPDLDGGELLRMLRAVSAVPVIIATARDDDDSVVQALDAGADDYVLKPFQAGQLEARIRAVLRRAAGAADAAAAPVSVADLTVDPRSRRVTLAGAAVELSPKEFDLLAYLAARAGTVVTKRELLAEVWQLPYGGSDKTVDVHLSWLRRKLGESAAEPRLLQTVRGVGVRLAEPES
jgi:two-component system KDP operon response regulator KdpE